MSKKLNELEKKRKLEKQLAEMKEKIGPTAQLNMDINAKLKATLQKNYGRNLTKLFEELAIEKLKKDGHWKEGA